MTETERDVRVDFTTSTNARRVNDRGHEAGRVSHLQADGDRCPMAHCNRNDSFHHVPSLRTVRTAKKIAHRLVSSFARNNLGCYTAQELGLCVYETPARPALVAYDYESARPEAPSHALVRGSRWLDGATARRSDDAGMHAAIVVAPDLAYREKNLTISVVADRSSVPGPRRRGRTTFPPGH